MRGRKARWLRARACSMGAAESRGARNEDKRTSRRENKDAFVEAIERMRARQPMEPPVVRPPAVAESGLHVCLVGGCSRQCVFGIGWMMIVL